MLQHPVALAAVLVGLVLAIQVASGQRGLRWAFAITPVPFWCYLLPMLGTTAGWWPSQSPLYTWLSAHLLPVCLVLLLLGTDLPALARMSRHALLVMLAGSGGIMLGMVTATWVWRRWLPPTAWQGLGALAGSWTGGSMNLLAVKEALGAPDAAIAPVILVDTVVAYSWMALLLLLSTRGRRAHALHEEAGQSQDRPRLVALATALTLAVVIAEGLRHVGAAMPARAGFSAITWSILLVTTGTLVLSLTPLARLGRDPGVGRLGTTCLFVLLASIGARADARALGQAPAFLAAGVTAVLIHGLVLLLVGWRFRVALGLLATASQANVGGVVSAPLVAAAYDRSLAPMGLLMAVLGNVIGTYAGLLTAALCRTLR